MQANLSSVLPGERSLPLPAHRIFRPVSSPGSDAWMQAKRHRGRTRVALSLSRVSTGGGVVATAMSDVRREEHVGMQVVPL